MQRPLAILGLVLSLFVSLLFGLFVANQTAQVVQLASTLNPLLGRWVLIGLLIVYAGLISVPAVLLFRLPRPLTPPSDEQGPEFEEYLRQLRERLAFNPRLEGVPLRDRREIEVALEHLAKQAEDLVKKTAAEVFVATAVSQNGRLDALLVLAAQTRMIVRVARLYHQRPTPRELARLYANVAGTAFLAGEIQDVDLSDQVQPIIASVVGALGTSLPGLKTLSAVLANSILDGSANAFLTLRVGIITARYCSSVSRANGTEVRKAATLQAAGLLGGIVMDGTNRVRAALWRASVKRARDFGGSVKDRIWGQRDLGALEAEV